MTFSANVVLTMAGRGSRFRNDGYPMPKWAVPAHGRALLDWSLATVAGLVGPAGELVAVSLAEERAGPAVAAAAARLGLRAPRVAEIADTTDGQATTVLAALEALARPDLPLIVWNVDSWVDPAVLTPMKPGLDGWVPVFPAPGSHWSFVRLDPVTGLAADVREKRRISNLATVGLYGFKDAAAFARLYDARYGRADAELDAGERYVAPLYRTLVAEGGRVAAPVLDPGRIRVMGTPEELAASTPPVWR